ncbi:major facilitator superfamily domain-containing protein 6-like [Clytia hemisphaerica]|uniref:Major facilitator superfamily associated domain-containing protein n=1 Tax=Clytia hemisphaerica TaxID=252671 RepID=A0A7M6DQG9_9CNID|eukprot:TCONS_00028183-protein
MGTRNDEADTSPGEGGSEENQPLMQDVEGGGGDQPQEEEEEEDFKLLNTEDRKAMGLCCPQVNRQLLLSKGYYFCFFSAWGSLLPYLALYFKQLMLTPSQVGVIMGLKPFVQFLATPVWGALVDKFHIHRFALVISMIALITSTFALSLVPGPKQQPIILEKHCNRTDRDMNDEMSSLVGEPEIDKMVLNDNTQDYYFSKDPDPWPLDFITNLSEEIYQKYKIDATQTFTSLFLITLFGNVIASPALALVDTATLTMLGKESHRYGKQRLTGSLGWGMGAFIVGASLKTTHRCAISKNREVVDFIPSFYVFAVLMSLGLIISLKLHFNAKKKAAQKRSLSVGLVALKQPTYLMFLFTALYLGFLMAFIKTFLFWHLKDLGGTQLLFSVISAVNCVAEVSMYFLSERLIKKIGEVRVLYLGLLCYSVRLFYYAVIPNTWMVLAVELLPGITTAAVWAACLSYVSKNSRPGAQTTMQCILHGVHWGLGYGAGEVIGGILVHHYGAPKTFVLFGCLCIVIFFIYLLINYIWRNSEGIPPPAEEARERGDESKETVEGDKDNNKETPSSEDKQTEENAAPAAEESAQQASPPPDNNVQEGEDEQNKNEDKDSESAVDKDADSQQNDKNNEVFHEEGASNEALESDEAIDRQSPVGEENIAVVGEDDGDEQSAKDKPSSNPTTEL